MPQSVQEAMRVFPSASPPPSADHPSLSSPTFTLTAASMYELPPALASLSPPRFGFLSASRSACFRGLQYNPLAVPWPSQDDTCSGNGIEAATLSRASSTRTDATDAREESNSGLDEAEDGQHVGINVLRNLRSTCVALQVHPKTGIVAVATSSARRPPGVLRALVGVLIDWVDTWTHLTPQLGLCIRRSARAGTSLLPAARYHRLVLVFFQFHESTSVAILPSLEARCRMSDVAGMPPFLVVPHVICYGPANIAFSSDGALSALVLSDAQLLRPSTLSTFPSLPSPAVAVSSAEAAVTATATAAAAAAIALPSPSPSPPCSDTASSVSSQGASLTMAVRVAATARATREASQIAPAEVPSPLPELSLPAVPAVVVLWLGPDHIMPATKRVKFFGRLSGVCCSPCQSR